MEQLLQLSSDIAGALCPRPQGIQLPEAVASQERICKSQIDDEKIKMNMNQLVEPGRRMICSSCGQNPSSRRSVVSVTCFFGLLGSSELPVLFPPQLGSTTGTPLGQGFHRHQRHNTTTARAVLTTVDRPPPRLSNRLSQAEEVRLELLPEAETSSFAMEGVSTVSTYWILFGSTLTNFG